MQINKHILPVLLIALSCLITSTILPSDNTNDIYSSIPQNRDHFIKQFELYVELLKNNHFDKLYELQPSRDKASISKVDYIKHQEGILSRDSTYQFLDFIPSTIRASDYYGDDNWEIFGCIIRIRSDKKTRYEGVIYASLENGNWYFSDYYLSFEGIGGPLVECSEDDCKKAKDNQCTNEYAHMTYYDDRSSIAIKSLKGRVTDGNYEPVEGVLIEIYKFVSYSPKYGWNINQDCSDRVYACITGKNGNISYSLPSGTYEVRASKDGWNTTSTLLIIDEKNGKDIEIDIDLEIGT